jgi:uncharacterized protein (TIGR04255 family)
MICFPEREDDVRLRRSPLREVVCQVRFPPILRIANEHPVEFQERIRKKFPQADIEQGMQARFASLGEKPPSMEPVPPIFRFKSADGETVASLAPSFYAVSTTAYTHWIEFRDLIDLLAQSTADIYDLPYASRVGLRYINNLTFENTGVDSVSELLEILRPEFTSLVENDCWGEPLEMLNHLLLSGDGDERLTLRSGFKGDDQSFLLDFDYYVEGNTPLDQVLELCGRYHDIIYRAFRWCIRDEKLAVFEPMLETEKG